MIGNILIVDDEPTALKLLKDILTADGHVVRPFNNGELALRSIGRSARADSAGYSHVWHERL